MKKHYLLILFLLAILLGLIAASARFYFIKEKAKPAANIIDESGYKIYAEGNKLYLEAASGERLVASEKLRSLIGQATLNSFIAPIDELDSSQIYLSSYEIIEGRGGEAGDPCASRNQIYKYNLQSGEAEIIFDEISRNGSPYSENKCRILRTVARQGNKLIILKDDPDNSGGPCTNIWVDYPKQFVSLDLSSSKKDLKPFIVPGSRIEEAQLEQQNCLNSLPVS